MNITYGLVQRFGPCTLLRPYDSREYLLKLSGGKKSITHHEVLALEDVPIEDRLWLLGKILDSLEESTLRYRKLFAADRLKHLLVSTRRLGYEAPMPIWQAEVECRRFAWESSSLKDREELQPKLHTCHQECGDYNLLRLWREVVDFSSRTISVSGFFPLCPRRIVLLENDCWYEVHTIQDFSTAKRLRALKDIGIHQALNLCKYIDEIERLW